MDKADTGLRAIVLMQQGVEYIIAHICACGVRKRTGNIAFFNGGCHLPNRDGRKICGRAAGNNRCIHWLIACIVSNGSISQIDGDNFQRYCAAATGLTNAKNDVGVNFIGLFQNACCCTAEFGWDLQLR